jgi:hypothetical protein
MTPNCSCGEFFYELWNDLKPQRVQNYNTSVNCVDTSDRMAKSSSISLRTSSEQRSFHSDVINYFLMQKPCGVS